MTGVALAFVVAAAAGPWLGPLSAVASTVVSMGDDLGEREVVRVGTAGPRLVVRHRLGTGLLGARRSRVSPVTSSGYGRAMPVLPPPPRGRDLDRWGCCGLIALIGGRFTISKVNRV
jgi:hypothetical protein